MQRRDSRYIHGSRPDEQRRLSELNALLNTRSLEALCPSPGDRVLDVGCGLGQLSAALARAVSPTGCVVGIERDPAQLRAAREHLDAPGLELREGEAGALPLEDAEWGSFDLAHARFLLEHVPDPEQVVVQMLRAVRPGGRVVLEDDDHDILRLWPVPEGFERLWRAYVGSYRHLGNDPYVGRRLVELLRRGGGEPVDVNWHFFGGCAGRSGLSVHVENLVGLLDGARGPMLEVDPMGAECFEAGLDALRAWGQRPDAALWYATCWAEGRRPH